MTDFETRKQRVRNGSRRKRDLQAVQPPRATQAELHDAARRAIKAGSKLDHGSLFVGAQMVAGEGGSLTDTEAIRTKANAYLREVKRRCDAHRQRSREAGK